MKRFVLLVLLVLVAGGCFYFAQPNPVALSPKIHKLPVPRKFFLGARKKITPPVPETKSLDGCEAVTNQLTDIDFNLPVEQWAESFGQTSLGECQKPEYKEKLAALKLHCFEKLDSESCVKNAIFLRAVLRTRGLEDADDREMLADLILKEFAGNTPDFKKLKKFSAKLMDLSPTEPAIQKLWASAAIVEKLSSGKSPMSLAQELNERINKDLWNDPEMQGIKMAMATDLKPEGVEEYARGFLAQKNDPRMHEILGWALWKQNQRTEAIAQLKSAIALNPKDQWLQEQLKIVNSKEAGAESYQARLSLGINMGDLY